MVIPVGLRVVLHLGHASLRRLDLEPGCRLSQDAHSQARANSKDKPDLVFLALDVKDRLQPGTRQDPVPVYHEVVEEDDLL